MPAQHQELPLAYCVIYRLSRKNVFSSQAEQFCCHCLVLQVERSHSEQHFLCLLLFLLSIASKKLNKKGWGKKNEGISTKVSRTPFSVRKSKLKSVFELYLLYGVLCRYFRMLAAELCSPGQKSDTSCYKLPH